MLQNFREICMVEGKYMYYYKALFPEVLMNVH